VDANAGTVRLVEISRNQRPPRAPDTDLLVAGTMLVWMQPGDMVTLQPTPLPLTVRGEITGPTSRCDLPDSTVGKADGQASRIDRCAHGLHPSIARCPVCKPRSCPVHEATITREAFDGLSPAEQVSRIKSGFVVVDSAMNPAEETLDVLINIERLVALIVQNDHARATIVAATYEALAENGRIP
jgi:hypothetical protein